MKKKDLAELHQKTYEELARSLKDIRLELAKMHLDLSMNKTLNTGGKKEMQRNIARILTIMSMKTPAVIEKPMSTDKPEKKKTKKVKEVKNGTK